MDVSIDSLLASDYENFEILLIDQNDSHEIEQLASRYSDSRLRYIRTETRGKCRALNLGIELSKAELILVTDDDCEVPRDWISQMVQAFDSHPSAALLYCNVVAGPHDRAAGFIPVYERQGEQLVTGLWQKREARGIGAGSGFRRSAAQEIGGFDEMLGPGGDFFIADDWDLTIRALLKGYHVFETTRTTVVHHGFRTHEQGRRVSWTTWYGIGAAYAKPIKCGRWQFLPVVLYDVSVLALWPTLRDSVRHRRPYGVARLTGLARGMLAGFKTPVNRASLTFESRL